MYVSQYDDASKSIGKTFNQNVEINCFAHIVKLTVILRSPVPMSLDILPGVGRAEAPVEATLIVAEDLMLEVAVLEVLVGHLFDRSSANLVSSIIEDNQGNDDQPESNNVQLTKNQ